MESVCSNFVSLCIYGVEARCWNQYIGTLVSVNEQSLQDTLACILSFLACVIFVYEVETPGNTVRMSAPALMKLESVRM
jgi:hypothetical protein